MEWDTKQQKQLIYKGWGMTMTSQILNNTGGLKTWNNALKTCWEDNFQPRFLHSAKLCLKS